MERRGHKQRRAGECDVDSDDDDGCPELCCLHFELSYDIKTDTKSVTTKGKTRHKTPLTLRGLLADVDDVEPACPPQHVSFRCARCQFISIFGRADV